MSWAPTLRAEIASMFARLSGCVELDARMLLVPGLMLTRGLHEDRAALACYSARRERNRRAKLASDPEYAARARETRRTNAQRAEVKRRAARAAARRASERAAAAQLAAYRAERIAARLERRAIR